MALTAVETAVMGLADRLAYLRGCASQIAAGGTDLWTLVDDTDDEDFENRVVGSDLTAADTALEDVPLGEIQRLRTIIAHLDTYCRTDVGVAGFDAYLTARRWRVPARFASLWYEATGVRLTATNVHPTADAGTACPGLALGTLARGGALASGLSEAGSDLYGPGPVVARVTAVGAADWTLTVTCKREDASTEDIEQVILGTNNAGAAGDTYVLGAEAVGSQAAAGQADVLVAATAQFAAEQKVLLIEWTGDAPDEVWAQAEVATIDSVSENTSLTLKANLLHTYSTAALVYPLFDYVTAATGSGGTAGDGVALVMGADRRLRA